MKTAKKEFVPSTSDIKILLTVSALNNKGLYPLPLGVYKILSGSEESEFVPYQDLETYGTLLSYSSKHVSRLIMMLVRNKYLEKIYDPNTDELYLKITEKGDMFLMRYCKKHKYYFKKKDIVKKPLIIKI